jgi:hypothetical protein
VRSYDSSTPASLSSRNTGYLMINDDYTKYLSGELSWQADACIETAMISARIVETVVSPEAGRFSQTGISVNGGKPF